MKKIISIAIEQEQALAIKSMTEATRSRSASALIRKALYAYAAIETPTLSHHFIDHNSRRSHRFTGKGATAHPGRRFCQKRTTKDPK